MRNMTLEAETMLLNMYCEYRKRIKRNIPRPEAAVFKCTSSEPLFHDEFLEGLMDLISELENLNCIICEESNITLTLSGITFAQQLLQSELVFDSAKAARREARFSLIISLASCLGTVAAAVVAILAFIFTK